MKKTISLRLPEFRSEQVPTSASRFSITTWMADDKDLDKKHILKGFVKLSLHNSSDHAVFIQSSSNVETDHKTLLKDEFPDLGTDGKLEEGVIGFQLRYKPDSNTLQFNPSSNHFGSVESINMLEDVWKALCKRIDFSDTTPELYIKSKKLSPVFSLELKDLTGLDDVNKKSIPHLKLNITGTIDHVSEKDLPRTMSFESDSSISSEESTLLDSLSSFSEVGVSTLFTDSVLSLIPTEDVVHNPPLYKMMDSLVQQMTPFVEGKHAFALGNSLSWPLELISSKQNIPVGFIPFSGNSVDFAMTESGPGFVVNSDRVIPDDNRDVFRSFLQTIEFTPESIVKADPPKVLFEYTETGRGLFTFLQFMDDWANEGGVMKPMRDSLNVIVFQGAVSDTQTPAKENMSFSPYSTEFIDVDDKKTLQEVCDNEVVRLIPSHKVYKTTEMPKTNHDDVLVQAKRSKLLELTCTN